jgi:hypothetical protein
MWEKNGISWAYKLRFVDTKGGVNQYQVQLSTFFNFTFQSNNVSNIQ